MLMRLFRILHGWGTGHYQFELSPDDNSSSANLFVKIDGSGVKTDGFGDTFQDANFSLAYNPETPVILSPSFSHWARGVHSSFAIHTSDATSVVVSALPSGLEYNASSNRIVGAPQSVVCLGLQLRFPTQFQAQVSLMNFASLILWHFLHSLSFQLTHLRLERKPSNLAGLSMHLDASALPDQNGSILSVWSDSSGK